MRSLPYLAIVALAVLALQPAAAVAGDSASASVVVTAHFSSRTSLKVSTQLLRFDVARPDQAAIAAVDFSAAARTPLDAEVVLSVAPLCGVEGPDGAAAVDTSLTFAGEGDGTLGGNVSTAVPVVAGRWVGSGVRNGRLVFSLRAAPGTYTVPVRFVLSAP